MNFFAAENFSKTLVVTATTMLSLSFASAVAANGQSCDGNGKATPPHCATPGSGSDAVSNTLPAGIDTTSTESGAQTATTRVINAPFLYMTNVNTAGAQSLDLAIGPNGDYGDNPSLDRTFKVASNSDHTVTIAFDAIYQDDACVPVFNAEGGTDSVVAGESDAIGGFMTLKVGNVVLWSANATADLADPEFSDEIGDGIVTISCASQASGVLTVGTATVNTAVTSTVSMDYTLSVGVHGEGGSIVFSDGNAISAGDAPAGAYDNDILISVGLTNTLSGATVDQYDGQEFGS